MIRGRAAAIAIALSAALAAAACGDDATASRTIPATLAAATVDLDGPHLRWHGRIDRRAPGFPRFAWPLTGFTVRFEGTGMRAQLVDTPRPDATVENDRLAVGIDGRQPWILDTTTGEAWHSLATGLPPGPHEITVRKITEAEVGVVGLMALELPPGARLLEPQPPRRHLLAIGDSITAGYGIAGPDALCHWSAATEDASRTWIALAARTLDAEPTVLAWSGRGISRNHDPRDVDTIVDLYPRTLPDDRASAVGRDPVADAVVINAGTNDFARGHPDATAFLGSYRRLLDLVRIAHPRAFIVVTIGPMLANDYPPDAPHALDTIRTWLRQLVSERRTAGDTRIEFLELWGASPAEGIACDYHPSARTHARMADQLVGVLRPHLGATR